MSWIKEFAAWLERLANLCLGLVAGYQLKQAVDQNQRAEGIKGAYEQLENAKRLSPSRRADILRNLSSKR